jgi:uncharacterized membrane protein
MEKRVSSLGIAIVLFIIVAAVVVGIYGSIESSFLTVLEATVLILLTTAFNALYVLGAGMIFLGSILVTIRYVKAKLKDPSLPFGGVPRARYLTISLEFFIGAEIIKTVVVRTFEEFLLLIFVIISRIVFSVVLYLDRRWHEPTETKEAK